MPAVPGSPSPGRGAHVEGGGSQVPSGHDTLVASSEEGRDMCIGEWLGGQALGCGWWGVAREADSGTEMDAASLGKRMRQGGALRAMETDGQVDSVHSPPSDRSGGLSREAWDTVRASLGRRPATFLNVFKYEGLSYGYQES